MPPGNGGVSIGVNANTQQAQRQIAGLGQGLGKLAANTKNLFGSGSAQQVNAYNKHLNQLERNLDRVNQRLKTLQGVQTNLIQQQRQLQTSGGPGSAAQLSVVQKALQQNQRSLSFWQAKQMGGQAAVQTAQSNAPRPGVGGGGGGFAGWAASQISNIAGGIGGPILKMLGIGAAVRGGAELGAKIFMTAADEQKGLADLYPKMHLGTNASKWSPKGYMNNVRSYSMPLGYSGIEGVAIENAISSGSDGKHSHLHSDSETAMQMARMFGIDAGSQASMLAEGGRMGAFVPGQAKRFAEMLAREIGVTGLGPRAQEMQEATLTLMQHQLATTGTTSASAAMTQQLMLAGTGVKGLQGQFGAQVLAGANAKMMGSTDDASIAFQEATLRDQRHIHGYYNLRRWKEQVSNDPNALRDTIREAYLLAESGDQAKDTISGQTGIPMTMLDKMGKGVKGGLRNIGANNKSLQMALKSSGGMVGTGAAAAMTMPGNEFRKGEATLLGVMAKAGTPIVQGIGTLVDKASTMIQSLIKITDASQSSAGKLNAIADVTLRTAGIDPDHGVGGVIKGQAKKLGGQIDKGGWMGGAVHQLFGDAVGSLADKVFSGSPGSFPVPPPGAKGTSGAQINKLRHQLGPAPFGALPNPLGLAPAPVAYTKYGLIRRGSADNEMHLHVHFDSSGAIHPHVKTAFIAMVGEALEHIQRTHTMGGLHHRYARA